MGAGELANDVAAGDVMGGDQNAVMIFDSHGVEHWPLTDKTEVAARLARRIADALTGEPM